MRTKRAGSSAASRLAMGCCFRYCLPPLCKRHVIVLGLGVVELVEGDHVDARAVLHHDALGPLPGRARAAAKSGGGRRSPSRVLARSSARSKRWASKGFKQVIGRVRVEGADGVLVVGGGEDDGRAGIDQLQHFEAIELGHLHVQEQQIGSGLGDGFHGIEAVGAFGRNLDLRMVAQQLTDIAAR